MDPNLEVRKLPAGDLFNLASILEQSDNWKTLMARMPKSLDGDAPFLPKYKVEHIKLVEQWAGRQQRLCAEVFLEEWSTSGRDRPTLAALLRVLQGQDLFRAADFVAEQLLGVGRPERPGSGPAAPVDVSTDVIEQLVPVAASLGLGAERGETPRQLREGLIAERLDLGAPEQETLPLDARLPHFSYVELENFTDSFCDLPATEPRGRKLGTGAFGTVYLGIFPSGDRVAVKRLNSDAFSAQLQFRNEIESLSRYRHENLLPLLGYSCDGPAYCLVYQYMSNGSLQERLACRGAGDILPWKLRLQIALKTGRGIVYLHTAYERPLIHRDIKSANILLDDNLQPKLGDFGLVRLGSTTSQTKSISMKTNTVYGTSAYMPLEAFRGDISVKLDTFSFGVVMLELLTALPPYDEGREGFDLVTHVTDTCEESIAPLLDAEGGAPLPEAELAFALALECIESEKRRRPTMAAVVEKLQALVAGASPA
ncbi:interleukin-1 receptor-associated kinase 4-like [Bacillus rossius redtenbacheri]|uniref:interleukin-1 receptor-associated kinase 4-like n=1 Tax=Bacillus rossius redtenbacheri TaxID=93214 RepID=UPI002FDEBF85